MRLGIGSYTFNWWAGVAGYPPPESPLTPFRLLEVAAMHKVQVVQIADNLPLDTLSAQELDRLAASARSLDITLETGTRGIQAEVLARYLEISRRLGSRLLRTLLDPVPEAEAIACLREAVPEFERCGVTLGIENHDRWPAATLRRIVDAVGSPALGICLDTANSLGGGEDLATVLDSLADVTVNLHIKDFIVRRLPHGKGFLVTGVPAGQGLVPIPALLDRLRSQGRDMNCILELWSEPEATIAESVAREDRWAEESLRYLRTMFPP